VRIPRPWTTTGAEPVTVFHRGFPLTLEVRVYVQQPNEQVRRVVHRFTDRPAAERFLASLTYHLETWRDLEAVEAGIAGTAR